MACRLSASAPLAFAAAVATLTSGCGDDLPPVYKTDALVRLDGQPFGPTRLRLVPLSEGGRSVVGEVDETGRVKFTTFRKDDGVPAGEYRVAVGLVMAPPPKPFPMLYRDEEKSPLKVTVEPKDGNELVIAMDSKAGPPVKNSDFNMLSKARQDPAFSAGATPAE